VTELARRWPGPAELVLAAVSHHATLAAIEAPDTGTLRGDVLELLRHVTARTSEISGVLSYLIADSFRATKQPLAVLRERLLVGPPTATQRILDLAAERGEISPALRGAATATISNHSSVRAMSPCRSPTPTFVQSMTCSADPPGATSTLRG
jgi:hypothetical protein